MSKPDVSDDEGDDIGGIPTNNVEEGPGSAYLPFVQMEELVEKLKLLKYDLLFCRELHQKPISRHYFALVTNSGEQFNYFTLLAAWLIQLCGRKMDLPQESDDPNAVVAMILHNLRSLGLKPDFPPNRLKTGSGKFCIWVLNGLADAALKATMFSFKLPQYPVEEDAFEDMDVEESILIDIGKAGKIEEDGMQEAEDYEDEENVLRLDDIKVPAHSREEIIESTTDAAEWKLEVERVLPQLRLPVRSDDKDWRVHLEQVILLQGNVETATKDIGTMLSRLNDEITTSMEKIESREKYISQQLKGQLTQLREARNIAAEVKEIYRVVNNIVAEKTRHLAELGDELEHVKREMEERGSSMTDGTPIVKIRQAISKARKENNQMDIRIGVLQHILLHYTLRHQRRFDMGAHEKILIY